jgi:preprotein translocase subunit SecG
MKITSILTALIFAIALNTSCSTLKKSKKPKQETPAKATRTTGLLPSLN